MTSPHPAQHFIFLRPFKQWQKRNRNTAMEAPKNAKATKKPQIASIYSVMKGFSPIRYLAKARDFYIRSISQCAGRANYNGLATGGLGVSANTLPKSFSTSSLRNDDEFGGLLKSSNSSPAPQEREIPRSFSSNGTPSVGRIDEDSPCYFPGSFRKKFAQSDLPYSRARSYRPAPISRLGKDIIKCA